MKRTLTLCLVSLLVTALCVLCLPACSDVRRSGNYRYTVENGEVTIVEYTGSGANVTIPDSINGMPVVTIGMEAFGNRPTLKSVTIPDSVIRINSFAFSKCEALESVTLGEGVLEIGTSVFNHCSKLTYHMHENGYYLGSADNPYLALVFLDAHAEEAVFHPDTRIICGGALEDCSELSDLVIPEGIRSIGAFSLPALQTVSFPASMESIDSLTFWYCKAPTEITVAEGNLHYKSVDGSLFSYDGARLIKYACGKEAESYAVPDGTVIIESYAFQYAKHLTKVTLPDSVEEIETQAFLHCEGLRDLHFGNGLKRIDTQAFGFCKSLTEVTIPDSVEELSYRVFSDCDKLKTVVIGSGVRGMDTEVFRDCDALQEVVFRDPDDWRVSAMYSLTSKKIDVSDPEQNVAYLTGEYCGYYWSNHSEN